MNRARVGIAGLIVIMLGLLLATTVNVAQALFAPNDQRSASTLVMLGYEPGQAMGEEPPLARPVLVECPDRAVPRPATV